MRGDSIRDQKSGIVIIIITEAAWVIASNRKVLHLFIVPCKLSEKALAKKEEFF